MKNFATLGTLCMAMTLALGFVPAYGFNSAAHIYIAEQVFPECGQKADLY